MPVWYAAYGSNLDAARFGCYLYGGRPAGASRCYPGCRNRTPPLDDRALRLPGQVFFGWHSEVWDGGIAFFDAEATTGTVLARGYLITAAQFADVAAQEMRRPPGADLNLAEVLTHARHSIGPGRYETLHLVGELEGHPILTFTAADPSSIERSRPSAAYLETMAAGLRESHLLDNSAIARYLDTLLTR